MIKRLAWLPLLLFLLLASLLVGSWSFVQAREQDILQTRLEVTAQQVAVRIEDYVANHLESLQRLGEGVGVNAPLDEDGFRELAAGHRKRHPGLKALNWVDAEGVALWVEPLATNPGVEGFDLGRHPLTSDYLTIARESRELVVTPPVQLIQGGWGIVIYAPVVHNGQVAGFLNAVFLIPDLLGYCLQHKEDSEFAYLLRNDDVTIGTLGPMRIASEHFPMAHRVVHIAQQELVLTVLTSAPIVAASGTWGDELQLLIGLGIAALLAGLVQIYRNQRDRAEMAAKHVRVLLENSPDAIVAMDAFSGMHIEGNRRAYDLYGQSEAEFPGLMPADISPERQPDGRLSSEAFKERLEETQRGQRPIFEWTLLNPRGVEILTEVQLVMLPDEGRRLVRASITDIRQRRELEQRLRRGQAHEAMGQIAGGVAHDFNNLLTAILGATELLVNRVQDDPEALELGHGIVETCQRAGRLTHQLLTFSRHSVVKPAPLGLNELVSGIVPMLDRVLSERVHLVTSLKATSTILADSSQIELALLNLTVNACDAMPEGGTITICTEDVAGAQVELTVEDDGQGIPMAVLGRVFEPYFTTKSPRRGTGIGLATVHEIVKQAKASITVKSEPGVGTRFRILFPAHDAEPVKIFRAAARRIPTGSEVILVVEDDLSVRDIITNALETAGYRVLSATSGEEALRVADRHEGPIDLLVTDVVLPAMTGVDLLDQLRTKYPKLPTLLVSGYSESDLPLETESRGQIDLLPKPFAPSLLVEKVQLLLSNLQPMT